MIRRRLALAASAVAAATLLVIAFTASNLPANAPRAEVGAQRENHEDPAGPEDFYLFERLRDGVPSEAMLAAAGAQAARIRTETRRVDPALASRQWRFRGPGDIGARVTDLVVDVSRPDTVYAASASGGVWVSRDAGETFHSIWPKSFPQAIGAIAQAPDGTLYVGTGETNPGGGSVTYGGDGVYKSTDRGQSWHRIGLANSSTIGRIAIDPSNPKHIYVAVSGNLFIPGGPRGLYETRDGGHTWTRAFAPPNKTTGAADVAVDPQDPSHVLVAMWDRIRYPDVR